MRIFAFGLVAVFVGCTSSAPQYEGGGRSLGNTVFAGNGSTSSGGDGGGPTDSGPTDAGIKPPLAINGCDQFNFADHSATADTRVINFSTVAMASQYDVPCMAIRAKQTVTFKGAFTLHPLEPLGGDTPNPITLTSTGTQNAYTFPSAGTFGFAGQDAPGVELGAIYVLP